MGISVDGNSIVIENCTITMNNAFDASTGVATITITPAGGLGTLPALLQGESGLPPVLRNINVNQIAPGDALPNPAAAWTEISPGGPGVAAVYDVTFNLYTGSTGSAGVNTSLTNAPDISGTLTNDWTLAWNAIENAFNYVPQLVQNIFTPASTTSVSAVGQVSKTLTSITVPGQPVAWYPSPSGQSVITGTTNTIITLSANLNSPTGPQCGVGYGIGGLTTQITLVPYAPNLTALRVPANTTATIYFTATETAPTLDAWSTTNSTTSFQVTTMPTLT